MTLFHFGNCVALAYFPYFIVYKCSGLSEYSAFWRCVKAGAAYLVTQLCKPNQPGCPACISFYVTLNLHKIETSLRQTVGAGPESVCLRELVDCIESGKMLVLATFFPTSDVSPGYMDFMGEFLRSTVDIADLVGLHLVMTRIAGKGELKVLVAGVGWATAEVVMTRLVPLWVGARGVEFDWKYIQMSFDANVSLVQHISTAALVWLWSRTDLQKSFLPLVMVFMTLACYRPLLIEVLSHVFGIHSWSLLLLKATFTSCIGIVALQLYLTLTNGKQNRT